MTLSDDVIAKSSPATCHNTRNKGINSNILNWKWGFWNVVIDTMALGRWQIQVAGASIPGGLKGAASPAAVPVAWTTNMTVAAFPERPPASTIVPGEAIRDVGTITPASRDHSRGRGWRRLRGHNGWGLQMKIVQVQVHPGPIWGVSCCRHPFERQGCTPTKPAWVIDEQFG